ncbi:hypothetical protein L6164_018511 [Bauhinia variegata]|uniref:Uncharacterized protein n=1 Tax=Bauhinia variegata TaxID=167791 RepID=A0ACB9NBZ0_BAUVA|nr:hypothetical protein L6164_018511 [Bauhinia variegata]
MNANGRECKIETALNALVEQQSSSAAESGGGTKCDKTWSVSAGVPMQSKRKNTQNRKTEKAENLDGGGAGKTTSITHIHNNLLTRVTNFSDVFWITFSQSFSIRKLQNDVAKVVGLNIFKENDEKNRAARLSQALMRRKKCVLILDDVWCRFPLEQVGIPAGADGQQMGSNCS